MATRPLYDRFAWAYDLVVDRPAGPTAEQVAALLGAQAVRVGSLIVDAGCGTGRHAAALTGLGYRVVGLDRSRALRHERRVAAGDDVLHYVGDTTLDRERRLMLVHERYTGSVAGARVDETYDFTQRCWTAEEVRDHGAGAGLARIEVVDGERAGIAADRLLIVASAQ